MTLSTLGVLDHLHRQMFYAVICDRCGVFTYSTVWREARERVKGHEELNKGHCARLEGLFYRPRLSGIEARYDHPDALPYPQRHPT